MNQRWMVGLVGACALIVLPSLASAQPGGGGRGGFGGGLMLLGDKNIQDDLEMADSQKAKVKELQDEIQSMFAPGGDRPDRDTIRTKFQDIQKKADEILLPHQKDRLKQIEVQSRLRFGNSSDAVADALKLTDDQKEALKKKEQEISGDMQKELTKVREKYRDKLLETLTPEQRAEWKKLVGNPVEFSAPQFGGGGRPGGTGAQGGQGGRRPGGNNNN